MSEIARIRAISSSGIALIADSKYGNRIVEEIKDISSNEKRTVYRVYSPDRLVMEIFSNEYLLIEYNFDLP